MAETKEKKIEIKKLVLQIGEREITLTPAEAEKLHAALGELFGKPDAPAQQLIVKETHIINQPYPVYNPAPFYWNWPIVTCTTTGGNNWTIGGDGSMQGSING